MFRFFRKIRQKLISENKVSKYILYAIGEIALVVIGILIALQINTWNENAKQQQKEIEFLKGISADLQKDSTALEQIIDVHDYRLAYFKLIDPEFEYPFPAPDMELDTTLKFLMLFRRGASYRTNSGTYSSMISDGKAQLISNRELYNELQSIYIEVIPHISSFYESLKVTEQKINWKWVKELRYPPYQYISEINDEHLIADLNYLHRNLRTYSGALRAQKKRISNAIQKINAELDII